VYKKSKRIEIIRIFNAKPTSTQVRKYIPPNSDSGTMYCTATILLTEELVSLKSVVHSVYKQKVFIEV
jgi:hypothetical protein